MKQKRSYALSCPCRLMFFLILLFGVIVFTSHRACANDAMEAKHLVEKATITLETFSKATEMEAFRDLVKDARGVFVAPQVLKGAFVIGASGGSGIFAARDSKTGKWSGPAFYTIGGASFGFQIGGNASEVVLLAMTERGVKAMLESNIKLGGDIGVAIGPVGGGAAASTANLSADIITFARSKGLYGGVSLDGAIVKTRSKWNTAYYGDVTAPSEILRKRTAFNPHSAQLIEVLTKLTDKR